MKSSVQISTIFPTTLERAFKTPMLCDVTDGIGAGGFSLETPYGKTFKVIYRLFTEEEAANLEDVLLNTY